MPAKWGGTGKDGYVPSRTESTHMKTIQTFMQILDMYMYFNVSRIIMYAVSNGYIMGMRDAYSRDMLMSGSKLPLFM